MGKLNRTLVLVFIVTAFALALFVIKGLFLNSQSNNSNGLKTKSLSQTFGRGFSNTGIKRLGEVADPNYKLSFPKDHNSHDSFDIEWWYLTANLQDEKGNDYGLQWTLFRFRNPNLDSANDIDSANDFDNADKKDSNPRNQIKETLSNWSNEHLYMAHASVHSASQHWFSEKFARGNVGNVSVEQNPFKLFIDDWQWISPDAGLLPSILSFKTKLINNSNGIANKSKNMHLSVQLNLSNAGSYVLQGQDGYSIKSANGKHASHYYSAPFINVNGSFTFSEALASSSLKRSELSNKITIKGKAWFDHEWTSQLLDQATLGWDWLSLHLDNGDKIMAFRMRMQDQDDYVTGTYIHADGERTGLSCDNRKCHALESILKIETNLA